MSTEEDLIIEGRHEDAEDRIAQINAQRLQAGCHPDELLCTVCGRETCLGHEDGVEPWQVGLDEYQANFFTGRPDPGWYERSQDEHYDIVRRALNQGKPVPPYVVQEYLDAGFEFPAPIRVHAMDLIKATGLLFLVTLMFWQGVKAWRSGQRDHARYVAGRGVVEFVNRGYR